MKDLVQMCSPSGSLHFDTLTVGTVSAYFVFPLAADYQEQKVQAHLCSFCCIEGLPYIHFQPSIMSSIGCHYFITIGY